MNAQTPTHSENRGKSQPLQRPKGTQDILAPDIHQWHRVEQTAHRIFGQAGYQEIRTPVFEYTELFERGVGEGTDIVSKEMYTFSKEERSLTLRPEYTAGVVRGFNENGLSRWPKPVKLYYMGPMFRYERPQEGRQRQFHQVGLELFGLDTPQADAEAMVLAMDFLTQLGVENLSLQVNNVGDGQDRETIRAGIQAKTESYLHELCENCQKRFHSNPLRMLDCKEATCQSHYRSLDDWLATDAIRPESRAPFESLLGILDNLKIPYQRNVRLVRGLDYYTRTVFEIVSTQKSGAQNAVCGGGRYNHLVEQLGGPDTPAVGWAMGMERIVKLLAAQSSPALDVYMATDDYARAHPLASALRNEGLRVEIDLSGRAMKKALPLADKRGARWVLIQGEAEREAGQWLLKSMATGEQSVAPSDISALIAALG